MLTILILFILVIGISFFCSILESVLLSVSDAYVAVAVKQNRRSGKLLEHLIEKINRPLSAILSLKTLTDTLGSAAIAYYVHQVSNEAMLVVVSILLTLMILVFSEIIPKSLGAAHWKELAPLAAYSTQAIIFFFYPLVVVSEKLTRVIAKQSEHPEITREEMIMNADLGVEEGTLKNKESTIIKNLLMLDKIYVADVMTPRSVFFSLEASETVEDVVQKNKPLRFSRIPVYRDNLDNIVGLTSRYRILEALSHDQHKRTIGELVTKIETISERMPVFQALDHFIKTKEHLALAIDEYGVVTGLVTLEDAIETLLGVEIVDEFDNVEDMRKYALEQWQLRKQKIRKDI
ncbi:MAG: HlyC/CorC family transporter [Bdellovibrionaceae bacterium]|nr:HlyC/CorC family transporter [Pseudobdellovibrionaceae bacterium]